MACGCGIRIPPKGSFGPRNGYGTGAGAVATDSRLAMPGGNGNGATFANGNWMASPITWILILVLIFLFVRRMAE